MPNPPLPFVKTIETESVCLDIPKMFCWWPWLRAKKIKITLSPQSRTHITGLSSDFRAMKLLWGLGVSIDLGARMKWTKSVVWPPQEHDEQPEASNSKGKGVIQCEIVCGSGSRVEWGDAVRAHWPKCQDQTKSRRSFVRRNSLSSSTFATMC